MKNQLNKALTAVALATLFGLGQIARAQDASPTPSPTAAPSAAPSGAPDHGPGGPGGRMRGGGGMRGGGMNLEMLTKELTLTDDQQAKIKPILEDSKTKMQALRSDTTTTREQKMPKMKEIRDATNTQIEAVLTADQKTKFEAMQQKMRDRMRGGKGGPGGPGGPGGGAGGQ